MENSKKEVEINEKYKDILKNEKLHFLRKGEYLDSINNKERLQKIKDSKKLINSMISYLYDERVKEDRERVRHDIAIYKIISLYRKDLLEHCIKDQDIEQKKSQAYSQIKEKGLDAIKLLAIYEYKIMATRKVLSMKTPSDILKIETLENYIPKFMEEYSEVFLEQFSYYKK